MKDKQCPKDARLKSNFHSTTLVKGSKIHKGVLEQLAEEQNSLLAINEAWSNAIRKMDM